MQAGPGFATELSGGHRGSTGRADAVAAAVLADPSRAGELWAAVVDPDPVVRGRAVDALEKASRTAPALLAGHEREVLEELAGSDLPEVRWHVGQLLGRLTLTDAQVARAGEVLGRLLDDPSRITQATALDGLVTLADLHPALADRAADALSRGLVSPYPSVRARARRLIR